MTYLELLLWRKKFEAIALPRSPGNLGNLNKSIIIVFRYVIGRNE